jgi:hypothetical protein
VRIAFNAAALFAVSFTAQAQTLNFPLAQQIHAYVTGYNTVPEQASPTPCIAASGGNICGRTDVVACPRRISLGSFLQIRGATYICEDRLAKKYDSRFDISCDKDFACPYEVTGWADIKVFDPNQPAVPSAPATIATMARSGMVIPVRHIAELRGRGRIARSRASAPFCNGGPSTPFAVV